MNSRRTMDRVRLPLNALRAFEAVGTHLSFTSGAASLRVTQSALSRHVAILEGVLECKLIGRRSNSLELTEAGRSLLPKVTMAFDRLEDALNDTVAASATPQRSLRIRVPLPFLQHVLLPVLQDFLLSFPGVPTEVSTADTFGRNEIADFVVVRDRKTADTQPRDFLWDAEYTPLCAPKYADVVGASSLADFFSRVDLLHVRIEDGDDASLSWGRFATAAGLKLDVSGGLTFDNASQAAEFASAGSGVLLGDTRLFSKWLAEGRLIAAFEMRVPDETAYWIETPRHFSVDPFAAQRIWLTERLTGAHVQL